MAPNPNKFRPTQCRSRTIPLAVLSRQVPMQAQGTVAPCPRHSSHPSHFIEPLGLVYVEVESIHLAHPVRSADGNGDQIGIWVLQPTRRRTSRPETTAAAITKRSPISQSIYSETNRFARIHFDHLSRRRALRDSSKRVLVEQTAGSNQA